VEHSGTKTLVTNRLILRRFEREDAVAMYENWASDSCVTKYLTWPCHDNVETRKTVLSDWIKQYQIPAFITEQLYSRKKALHPLAAFLLSKRMAARASATA